LREVSILGNRRAKKGKSLAKIEIYRAKVNGVRQESREDMRLGVLARAGEIKPSEVWRRRFSKFGFSLSP
jgi:hypothetical protein